MKAENARQVQGLIELEKFMPEIKSPLLNLR